MASEEHLKLANEIKQLHKELRINTKLLGVEEAWKLHLKNQEALKKYASNMIQLSENFWKINLLQQSEEQCRINWTVKFCNFYFQKSVLENYRKRDLDIIRKIQQEEATKLEIFYEYEDDISETLERIKLLDVGSSFNPFKQFEMFEILAIDISPADPSVFYCDFLNVPVENKEILKDHNSISSLPSNYFNVIVFSLLLEYLPTSDQRILCCQKAYNLLKNEGILVILTPDSKHAGANAKLMKNWRYTLSIIGFQRIKIEKLKNLTCLVFRKTSKEITERWARKYKEEYMTFLLNIPQDNNKSDSINIIDAESDTIETIDNRSVEIDCSLFEELPQFLELE